MSDKRKWPFAQAMQVAWSIFKDVDELSTRCAIAGSLRRRKPYVGDIEILYVPKMERRQVDLLTTGMFSCVDELLTNAVTCGLLEKRPNKNGQFAWGDKNKLAIHKPSGISVDFFATTEENWWVALMIRTGPKDWNLKLTNGAQSRGLKLNAYGCGVTNLSTGEVIRATSEQHVAELCGVPYAEPEDRR